MLSMRLYASSLVDRGLVQLNAKTQSTEPWLYLKPQSTDNKG